MMKKKRFRGNFQGKMLVSVQDTQRDCNVNILQIIEIANALTCENEQLKQEYNKLKHKHSLLHDVCIEAECDRDSYHKDVLSLEKENEQLKKEGANVERLIDDLGSEELRRQYEEIINGDKV